VLAIAIVLVLDKARSITSTSTSFIRLGGWNTFRRESTNAERQNQSVIIGPAMVRFHRDAGLISTLPMRREE
jgi:hypothetical protein